MAAVSVPTVSLPAEAKAPGLHHIVDAVEARLGMHSSPRTAMEEVLTFGRRSPLDHGVESLTPMQAAVFEQSHHLVFAPGLSGDGIPASHRTWYLGQWSYGRIYLAASPPTDAECRCLGRVGLTPPQFEAVQQRAAEIAQQWARCDAEQQQFFEQHSAVTLQRVIDEVDEAIDHIDPVLLYLGDTTLTNHGKFNNLQERNGADLPHSFFRRARSMPWQAWSRAEQTFVFCFHLLRLAGCRGEEFNGRQLNPALLDDYFDKRLLSYNMWLPTPANARPRTIAEKATRLSRCKAAAAVDALTYRWINGLNFYKEERLYPRSHLRMGLKALPDELRTHLASHWGLDADGYESLKPLFEACVAKMAQRRFVADGTELSAPEQMLQTLVGAAISATGSDVGMTRGIRDLAQWQTAMRQQDYGAVCAWPTGHYYCAVFASPAFEQRMKPTPEQLFRVLYACSGRMQFNSWHYMPGHCPRESVPADRHFYWPPRMPDTAIWSDQHHPGHMHAEVRFSIRSPAPLEFDGHVYPGMLDLRLFRQSGEPYSDRELFTALTYTDVIRAFCQALSTYIARGGTPVRIQAFDKAWFQRRYVARPGAKANFESSVP